ncbi:MAG: hypothetical protein R3B41_02830 [Candidatus Doudnabacteria bacterium]
MEEQNQNSLTSDMPSNRSNMREIPGSQNNLPWVILAVVILFVILGAVLFRDRLLPEQAVNNGGAAAEQQPSGYQAVFLSNGQVYFGKLSDVSATYATLKDIYYLQVTTPPLQGSQTESQSQQQQQLSLVKLGEELHGPVDEMKINRSQILFFEDLKEEGQVMQAIRQYQENPQAAAQAPVQQTTPPTTEQQSEAQTTK